MLTVTDHVVVFLALSFVTFEFNGTLLD